MSVKVPKYQFLRDKSGGVTVEFVLLLPIVLMVFLVIVDFGSFLLKKQNLSSITRGIVTIISNSPDFTADQAQLLVYAQNSLGPGAENVSLTVNQICSCNNAAVSCVSDCSGISPKMIVEATLSYDHTLLFPYPGLDGTVQISDTLEFRVR